MNETIEQEHPIIPPGAFVPGTDPLPTDLPADTEAIVGALSQLADKLDLLIDATARAEVPASGTFFALPAATGRNDFPQPIRVRLTNLVLSVSAACTVTVTIGSAAYTRYDFVGAATIVIPFPELIDSGKDVVVAASAGTLRAAYFTGYPEAK